eukprot:6990888-Prorocentrum_lima.AAC.1
MARAGRLRRGLVNSPPTMPRQIGRQKGQATQREDQRYRIVQPTRKGPSSPEGRDAAPAMANTVALASQEHGKTH